MKSGNTKAVLYFGASLLAVCGALAAVPTFAQDTNAAAVDGASTDDASADKKADKKDDKSSDSTSDSQTVIVVGQRQSIKSAQAIKKQSENVVDSITATDVGQFPDRSVAEALQRVAGVTVSRFAATGDTQHFSAEPSGVIVRGLPQVKSTFNGRDTFSADSSRGLGWEDVSPELMSRVDVFKNQSADILEGGIAGLVDLRTRVPFDSKGQLISLSVDDNYSYVANKQSPSVSGLYSNRWQTSWGEFGLMAQGAWSQLHTRSQSVYNGRYGAFQNFGGRTDDSIVYIPTFISTRDTMYDRERQGGALAAQWQNNDHTMVATLQFNKSNYNQTQTEYTNLDWQYALWGQGAHTIIPSSTTWLAQELPDSPFTFNEDGSLATGVLSQDRGWKGATDTESSQWAVNSLGQPIIGSGACQWNGDDTTPCPYAGSRIAMPIEAGTRRIIENSMTEDLSFNFKWDVNDRLKLNFDVQSVHATKSGRGGAGAVSGFTGMSVDFTGDLPKIEYTDPFNVNLSPGGSTNPDNYYYAWIQEHKEYNVGNSIAGQFDAEYSFDGPWLASVKFGIRQARRDQVVQSAWPFQGITGFGASSDSYLYYNTDRTSAANVIWNGQSVVFNGYPDPALMLVQHSFPSNYMSGGVTTGGTFMYIDPAVYTDSSRLALLSHAALGIGDYSPICSATGNRSAEILNADGTSTCFTPDEHLKVGEQTRSAYLMLRFGGRDATLFGSGVTLSGNIGVRYVETTTDSYGSFNFNSFTDSQLTCTKLETAYDPTNANPDYVPAINPYSDGCYVVGAAKHNAEITSMPDTITLADGSVVANPEKFVLPESIVGSPDDFLFHDGSYQSVHVRNTVHNWLPSLNLKFQLDDKQIVRFAYSRGLSRADMGMFRYQANLYNPMPDVSALAQCKTWDKTSKSYVAIAGCTVNTDLLNITSSGELVGASPKYSAWTGNPWVKPTQADSFDLTYENYFASVGSFTLDLFYKKFYDYITYDTMLVPVTNNGVTRNVWLSGPVNGDGASVKGYEASFTRVMDFLPSPWNGLGLSANYTHIVNHGVTNTNLDAGSGGSASLNINGGTPQPKDTFVKTNALEGMSKDAYNISVFYDKGNWGGRIAYNWRSKYLVTSNDCCNYPEWQGAQGYLDASMHYRINDHYELSLDASNLTDTTTRLYEQVTDATETSDGKIIPSAWFKSDRRISMHIRMKY